MTDNAKAIIIQTILIIVCGVLTIVLSGFFRSKGFEKLESYCAFIMPTVFGLYIFIGKYVYIKGIPITKSTRIGCGLFFLLLMPVIWVIKMVAHG
jgi:hypothetical protein